MANYGFIISRHVNSERTNKYWNECVRCIQKFHYGIPIVIIDDNSNYEFVKSECESNKDYENVTIIQSEYPRRGELLPYYYFWKNHWWENAVIIHDSVFIQNRVPYRTLKANVLPLWHFGGLHRYEDPTLCSRIASRLKNNMEIKRLLHHNQADVADNMSINNNKGNWYGVFGVQSYIKYIFLDKLQKKYAIFNMLNCVQSRPDRCCLERIMGVIFFLEDPTVRSIPSLFGNITSVINKYGQISYETHKNILKNNGKANSPYVKVWTGR